MDTKFPQARGSDHVFVFLNVDETLIRTGELSPRDRVREAKDLNQFTEFVRKVARRAEALDLVLLSDNSFEYCRRVAEPLGLKNFDNVNVTIISENGLLARSFSGGDLWRATETEEYRQAADEALARLRASAELSKLFFTPANELRVTLNPVANRFTPEHLSKLSKGFEEATVNEHYNLVTHPFHIDLDPKTVLFEGRKVSNFDGRAYAVGRLLEGKSTRTVAVGNSLSDVAMFRAVKKHAGHCFWVSNAVDMEKFPKAPKLPGSYARGVNRVLGGMLGRQD